MPPSSSSFSLKATHPPVCLPSPLFNILMGR